VYLNWALALRANGCCVIWLEGVDLNDSANSRRRRRGTDVRRCIATLKKRLEPYVSRTRSRSSIERQAASAGSGRGLLDLDAAAEADLLLNLWHSLPSPVVRRFRRPAFVDTDPGLLQTWMTTGELNVAPHDIYFTVGEAVGTPAAPFPDCGLRWHYTPPPVFLPEWLRPRRSPAPRTRLWPTGGRSVRLGGEQVSEISLPHSWSTRTCRLTPRSPSSRRSASGALREWRACLEPLGWRLRDAWT